MFQKSLFTIFIFFSITTVFSQQNNDPYYWKNNKLLGKDYWQQDVHYQIQARIDDSLDIIHGDLFELTYTNNSPDTLAVLYFHLYQNAFQPHSHMSSLYEENDKKITYGKYEKEGLGTTIENLTVNGNVVDTELDNTVLKVILKEKLVPNASAHIKLSFKTYYDTGSLRRRMKTFNNFGFKHFDGVHWYPSICVYDQKFGWTTEQHTDKEFYADFGTFDVKLTFPNDYIVDATGVLQNEKEVLPDSLREKIDLKNFTGKSPIISMPIERNDANPKTWHFIAENVHNFAFTADPTYRIGEVEWKGIKVITLAQEPNAHAWQESGIFARDIIKTYSENFGHYAWPKIIIADAQDGMEYPMLTLDGGNFPEHRSLLAHEIGHMWFYGMLGSNETYRAFLDEGFTQFLTIWSMDTLTGKSRDYTNYSKYTNKHKYSYENRYHYLYYPYLRTVRLGNDMPLNTHSSDFNGAVRHGGNYGLVYFKAGVMLYNLRYVLGDELFQNAMKYYVNKWKMAHPYPEDFRQSIIEYTKVDLNWFFDQWLETTKSIDYKIVSVKKEKDKQMITFERKGEMQMPLDLMVALKNGDTLKYHIPNTWFVKNTNATVLPKWYGYSNINRTYEMILEDESEIEQVIIDPDHFLADIDLTNNQWKKPLDLTFENFTPNIPYWYKTENFIRPYAWHNNVDVAQLGIHVKGNYFKQKYHYEGTVWANLEQLKKTPVSWKLYSEESLMKYWQHLSTFQYFQQAVGVWKGGLGIQKKFQKRDLYNPKYTIVKTTFDAMYRENNEYLENKNDWTYQTFNNSINTEISRYYPIKNGKGILTSNVRTNGLYSDINYTYIDLESIHHKNIKRFKLHTRLYGRLGSQNTPIESALWMNGANPEMKLSNQFTQTIRSDVHYGGGLNVRSLADQKMIGNSGIGGNVEFDFNQWITKRKIKFVSNFVKLNVYLFSDIGYINDVYVDGGIGSTLTFSIPNSTIEPITLRFDYSIYDNFNESQRFIFGINRSF